MFFNLVLCHLLSSSSSTPRKVMLSAVHYFIKLSRTQVFLLTIVLVSFQSFVLFLCFSVWYFVFFNLVLCHLLSSSSFTPRKAMLSAVHYFIKLSRTQVFLLTIVLVSFQSFVLCHLVIAVSSTPRQLVLSDIHYFIHSSRTQVF